MTSEESLANAENLLARLESARTQLEHTDDPERAIAILQELADLAKEVEGGPQVVGRWLRRRNGLWTSSRTRHTRAHHPG